MEKKDKNSGIIDPINQLSLFGYDDHFNTFINLHKKSLLPNVILLNGQKGIGKSTFVFHFVNYLFSQTEEYKYSLEKFKIDEKNVSYKLLSNGSHPNFFFLSNKIAGAEIKIAEVRNLLSFLSKSSYSKNIKIVLIDNAENLNQNSSNALLKALEEPKNNTFFFINYNFTTSIPDTIKSRCLEFKFFFNRKEKKKIFMNIIKDYSLDFDLEELDKNFLFDTPGNILKYSLIIKDSNINISNDKLSLISHLFNLYSLKKDPELLQLASTSIENFYSDLSFSNKNNLNTYFTNKYKILNSLSNMHKFNLDKKNTLNSVYDILENEKK